MSTLCQLDLNNYFIGVAVTDVDPLDPTNTLIPAGVVDAPPPSPQAGYLAKWDGAWVYEKNDATATTLPKPALSATQVADLNTETTLLDGSWAYAWMVRDKTQAELDAELTQWRNTTACTRQQGKLAIGEAVWNAVLAMLDDPATPWGLRVAIEDTSVWSRNDEDMAALIWAMGLTDAQADDLFRLAATL